MDNGKTSLTGNGLLWFGAAVSLAEILAGTLLAPLGFARGLLAILLGHAIGCALLYCAGYIGAVRNKSAMESAGISFGRKGSYLFSVLNVLQLVGWTAVMIISGAKALGVIANPALHIDGTVLWCVLIGATILAWVAVGIKRLDKVNVFAVGALFVLTILLSSIVFRNSTSTATASGTMSFGAAMELSVAMPLSWLPLISDYTRNAQKPKAATLVSVLAYFAGSSWMYAIGLGAAIFTAGTDIAGILLGAGLGIAGLLIVVLSNVTTTFLDAYSAGVSFKNIAAKSGEKRVAIVVCIVGTVVAIFTPVEQYVNFLYLIGSVFAPMIAILFTDFFILKTDHSGESFNLVNLLLWAAGFALYRFFLTFDTALGSTLPVMVIICALSILVNEGRRLCLRKS